MGIPIFQVDAFSDTLYRGNPAGVCLLEAPGDPGWMQDVAREMNLSETAFVIEQADGFALQWFTPTVEVELCGHATLASAHILWETGRLAAGRQARFHTASGLLTADSRGSLIEMDFPATPAIPADAPSGLIDALGIDPLYVGKTEFDWLVVIDAEDKVRAMAPDFARLETVSQRGVMVTAEANDPEYDFVSRFFAPAVGINEDPVTGSAHCCLGPYWCAQMGRESLTGYQASARGGTVQVRLAGERVMLGGQAVTVLRGELTAERD